MCFGSSIKHVKMNLMYPDNHSKGEVELTIKQKEEIDSELTTLRVESQIGSKSKVEWKFCSISPKPNRKNIISKKKFFQTFFHRADTFPLTSYIEFMA